MFESTRIAEEWLLYSYDVVGMKVECSDNRRLGYAVPLQRERGRVLAGLQLCFSSNSSEDETELSSKLQQMCGCVGEQQKNSS